MMQPPDPRQRAARALLAWWRDAGIEADALAPAPVRPQSPAPQASASAQKPASRAQPDPGSPIAAAERAAASAADLNALIAAIEAFDGCALKKAARNTVVADGALDAPILVLGEAPGGEEDASGKPFVGPAGQLLDRMLGAIGLSRTSNILITNMVYWRPPGNRNPSADEIAICRPFVERMIALKQPKAVVIVGGVSAQALLQTTEGVTKLRGARRQISVPGLTMPVNAMVMLHPAYLLRQPPQKRLAWADLVALARWLDELGVPRDPRPWDG